MKLAVSTELDLEGSQKNGFVTWLDVKIVEGAEVFGTARIALVHVGEIADASGEVWPALNHARLDSLHNVYFAQGWYKDEYADGAGIDLLYIDSIEIDPKHRNKNLDLALVRRLCDTLGSGCQISVVAYPNADQAAHWSQLGFEISTPGRITGFMHLKLGYRQSQVVDATGSGDYEVVSTVDSLLPTYNSPRTRLAS